MAAEAPEIEDDEAVEEDDLDVDIDDEDALEEIEVDPLAGRR